VTESLSRDRAEICSTSADWLVGGGEMARLVRALDWAQTPLGPAKTWSPALRMIVGLLECSAAALVGAGLYLDL
jgi:hypothetical protein